MDKFKDITGFDMMEFIVEFSVFSELYVSNITDYYSGLASPDGNAFKKLSYLLDKSYTLNELIINNSIMLSSAAFWEIVESADDILGKLETISNTNKWVRSNIAKNDFNTDPEIDAVLKQFNTVEDLARSSGYDDSMNSWTRIAMRNDLDEDDYTPMGGNILKINVVRSRGIDIDDVVDVMSGENMKGKDISTVIEFVDQDLNTVYGDDCLMQCYNILLNASKNSIPEFPEMGIGIVVGGNISTFSYPVILRQIHRTFSRDDSVESVSIVGFDTDNDISVMDIGIKSKFGIYIKKGVAI